LSNQSPNNINNTDNSASGGGFDRIINAKLLICNIRQNRVVMIIAAILLFCARPLVQIISLIDYFSPTGQGQMIPLYRFAYNNAVGVSFLVPLATLLLAIGIGINVTKHMHDRKSAIFHNSLPIKRKSLFATQYLSGLAYFIPAFAFSYILSLVLMPFHNAMMVTTYFYLGTLLLFLLIYSFVILCGNIGGTVMNTILAAIYLCAVLPALFYAIITFLDAFYRFTSISAMVSWSFWEFIYYPIIIYFPTVFTAYNSLRLIDCILMLFFAAALTVLAYLFNRLTKTENAEKPFYFEKFLAVLKYSTLAAFVILSGMMFYLAAGDNILFLIIGILIGGFLSSLLLNLIIYRSIREVFKGIKQFLIFAVCACVVAGAISADIFGIDRHIPSLSRTDMIYTHQWSSNFAHDFSFTRANARHAESFWSGNTITIRDPETMQLVNNVIEATQRSERRSRISGQYWDFSQQTHTTDFPFMRGNGMISYQLTSGRTWVKRFNIFHMVFTSDQGRDALVDALVELIDSDGYRQAYFYPLTDQETMRQLLDYSQSYRVILRAGDSLSFDRAISRYSIEELIAALNTDISALSMGGGLDRQYDLSLVFVNPDGYFGGMSIAVSDLNFPETLALLLD